MVRAWDYLIEWYIMLGKNFDLIGEELSQGIKNPKNQYGQ